MRTVVLSLFVPHPMEARDADALLEVLETAEALVASRGWARARDAAPGQIGVVYAVEGAGPLAARPDLIPSLVGRGVQLFGLVHTHHNALAESSSDPHSHPPGLSKSGKRFVRAVYDAGALIDVSHASDASFDDVAAIALEQHKPIVASHSNARAVADHDRNLTDAQLRVVADTGGVVGVAFHAPFLRRAWREASVEDLVQHVAHMRAVMGPGHVAIGSDLDGLITAANGLSSHASIPAIATALQGSGLARAEVAAVLGGNAARILAP